LGDRFEDIETMYAAARPMPGRLVKVTPSSKVVGDSRCTCRCRCGPKEFEADPGRFDIPDSVIGSCTASSATRRWLAGTVRTKAIARPASPKGVSELSDEDTAALVADPRPTLNRLLFPGPTKEFPRCVSQYGDTFRAGQQGLLLRPAAGVEYPVTWNRCPAG